MSSINGAGHAGGLDRISQLGVDTPKTGSFAGRKVSVSSEKAAGVSTSELAANRPAGTPLNERRVARA